MNMFFWVSYVFLWLLVTLLFAAVFFLYRHHGEMLLNGREGRQNQGPALDKPLPTIEAFDLEGMPIQIGYRHTRLLFMFFVSPGCKPCADARKAFIAFSEKYYETVESLLVCQGNQASVGEFVRDFPGSIRVIPDCKSKLRSGLRVSSTPFALIADCNSVVRAKGMPVNQDGFEWFVQEIERRMEIPSGTPEISHGVSFG